MSQDKQERREFIPFEVVRKADTDLSEGEEIVLIEGREGIRFFSEEGKLIHSTEPVTEMRIYGPKSRIVDFKTVRTPNADLEPGEERVVQEGFTGIELVDDEGNIVSASETANTEIEYGPEREEIPFTMVRVANDDLEPGEERVITPGKMGVQLVDEEGNITPLKRPIGGELEYGPERIEIPFDEVRTADSNLDQGAEEIVVQGEVGIDIQTEDGEQTRIKEPVAQETNYGPERFALPFESKRISNSDLDEGQENILVAGVDGLDIIDEEGNTTHVSDPVTEEVEYGPERITLNHETTYKVNFDLDEGVEEVVTEGQDGLELKDEEGNLDRISDPVTEIIEYGPNHVQVDFETLRRSNPDLDEGQEQVIVEGEYGLDLVDRGDNTTRQKEPVAKEIEYGPKRIAIPYEEVRLVNVDLDEGQERVRTEGQEGIDLEDEQGTISRQKDPQTQEIEYGPQKITIEFETDYKPNQRLEPFEETVVNQGQTGLDIIDEAGKRERINAPVTEVIEYGPERETIPYETVRKANHEIAEGEETVLVEGQTGTEFRDRHGEIIETINPVTEEIEYGPIRIVLPYETKRVPSKILYPGTEEVKVRGVDGLDVEDEEGNIKQINEPVTEVVEYGQERITIPYKVDRIPNVKLAPGKEKIITPGKEGYRLRDEKGYESDGINSVTQVVEYGPHKETVPFGYIRHVNKDLAQGEERLIADGQDGLQFVDDEGNVLKSADPVDAVVEYGPSTRVIPFGEERQLNKDLSPGEELVISEGIDGIELVDEEGNVVSRFNPYPRIIAYGE